MAFKIHSTDDGRVPGLEYLPCAAITPKVGMALTQTGGVLTTAAGTTAPTYICMCERETPVEAGTIIPVVRVGKDMVFETSFSAAATSVKLGSKVTLASGGLQVTATTTDGVAEVVYMDGTASGSMCRIRF